MARTRKKRGDRDVYMGLDGRGKKEKEREKRES